jgi:hypothetical protein
LHVAVSTLRLQHACGDPESRGPDPVFRRSKVALAGKRLGESFGQRVAGDLGVSRVTEKSTPESAAKVAICDLEPFTLGGHDLIVAHMT